MVVVIQSYFLFENYANSQSMSPLEFVKNAIFGGDEEDVMIEALGLKVRQATNELSEEKFEDAIEELEEFREKNPEEYLTYQNLGIAQYRKAYFFNDIQLYSKAIENLNKAIELNPNDHVSHTWLGWVYVRLEDYDSALKNFDKALRIDPKGSAATNGKAMVFRRLELFNKSVEFSKQAISLNPNVVDYYTLLGWTYHNMDEYDKSNDAFQRALLIRQDDYIALDGIGWNLDHFDKFDEAYEYFSKSVEKHAAHHNIEGLARAYYGQGKYKEAVETSFKLVSILENLPAGTESHGSPYPIIAWSYYREGNFGSAIKTFEEITGDDDAHLGGDIKAALGLAASLHKNGQEKEAEELLASLRVSAKDVYDIKEYTHHKSVKRYDDFVACISAKSVSTDSVVSCIDGIPSFGIG